MLCARQPPQFCMFCTCDAEAAVLLVTRVSQLMLFAATVAVVAIAVHSSGFTANQTEIGGQDAAIMQAVRHYESLAGATCQLVFVIPGRVTRDMMAVPTLCAAGVEHAGHPAWILHAHTRRYFLHKIWLVLADVYLLRRAPICIWFLLLFCRTRRAGSRNPCSARSTKVCSKGVLTGCGCISYECFSLYVVSPRVFVLVRVLACMIVLKLVGKI